MASGDLTMSTPTLCTGMTAVKTAVDLLNLALTTDRLVVVPITGANNQFMVAKVTREA